MIHYSILDLANIYEGESAADAFQRTRSLAIKADTLGYRRFWVAEHHNMVNIASAATSLLIGYIAEATERIRVGSGGVMLPNHSPLVIAEQFGTLASLYPDRIDLGVGRAPGSDAATSRALRRLSTRAEEFPQDVVELLRYFSDESLPIEAIPGKGLHVPIWILGSSLFGAQLAAHLGLPYAFAAHFAPAHLEAALDAYHQNFRPSPYLEKPYAMICMNAVVAPTDEEAQHLFTTMQQAFTLLLRGARRATPPPITEEELSRMQLPRERRYVSETLRYSAVGSPETVKSFIQNLLKKHDVKELMFAGAIYDNELRLRSFTLLDAVMNEINNGK